MLKINTLFLLYYDNCNPFSLVCLITFGMSQYKNNTINLFIVVKNEGDYRNFCKLNLHTNHKVYLVRFSFEIPERSTKT